MLGRASKMVDLMAKYGVTNEVLVAKCFGSEEKATKEGLKTLDLVVDYRNCNLETAKKFLVNIGATDEEVKEALADIELYKKVYKPELDKEISEVISGIEKEAEAKKATAYAAYDEKVKALIAEKVYGQGANWKAEEEKKAAAKAASKKSSKKETSVTNDVVTEESPVEAAEDPFAEG